MPAEPEVPPEPPEGVPAAGEPGTSALPPLPVREVLGAGFTHGDREENARRFAAGGPLDVMEPGPVRRAAARVLGCINRAAGRRGPERAPCRARRRDRGLPAGQACR